MAIRAELNNYRVSARKARLVADEIRGKGVEDALMILDLSPKRFSKSLAKLLRSALANAEEKNTRDHAGIDIDNLVVGKITVDQGPSMWRIKPRAQGRASWIQRKTANIAITLAEE